MSADFLQKFHDPKHAVYFVGTTPPKAQTEDEQMADIADKLLERLQGLNYDGLIVYDIQDESARTDIPRPFPFRGTRDPREYSKLLADKSGKELICYKSVSQRDRTEFEQWVTAAQNEFNLHNLVLVGSPSRTADIKLSLPNAYTALRESSLDFNLGGVTIAERHAKKGDEHIRLKDKTVQGCQFFVSQAVYDADATKNLLESYGQLCRLEGRETSRIILTFTACGSAKTLEFMRWLGISVPEATADRIINADNSLEESIKLCQENLRSILQQVKHLNIPIGLNIESLTNRKEEIEASIKLFKLLQEELESALSN